MRNRVPILLVAALIAGRSTAFAAEPPYPLWDNVESVADYARKVNLPPTRTLDLGNGVQLELVLVPAGKFVMGTPEPIAIDEGAFTTKIVAGQKLCAASVVMLVVVLFSLIRLATRKKRRPQLSLALLVVLTLVSGAAVLSYMHWRESERLLGVARFDYAVAKARYDLANDNEKPAHPVTLTKPFYMGKYDITQEQYQAVIGANPSNFKGNDNPVEQVSWFDAQKFCKEMTERTKETIRLPTEAEWEYACRAGTETKYYSGDSDKDLDRVGWYWLNCNKSTHPVGQKEANAFGLFDMHGNVYQWCQDLWYENYYMKAPAENPHGPAQGAFYSLRGGCWINSSILCRASARHHYSPEFRGGGIGFRVMFEPELKAP